jgi:peptidyl-prolyl cis-trans isomerase D
MPLMTKIRENLSTFFSIFAGVFVVYIVLDWGMDITGRRHRTQTAESTQVGKINDQAITYREFEDLVKDQVENQKKQTGTDPDENQVNTIRDQVWEQLIDQKLYEEAARKLNVSVTDQELIDWVRGDNPPDFLRQQFTDSTGTFKRAQYDQTIMDPRNKNIMVTVEDFLRKQRLKEKLQSIVLASMRVSEQELMQRFIDQNIKYEADYALFDPNQMIKNSDIKITDDDLRKYYNDNTDEFKVEASRKLKYVLFKDEASKTDTDDVVKEMADIKSRTSAGADFTELMKTYSETPASERFFKHGEIPATRETALFNAKPGDLVGPILESDGYHLDKVLEFHNGTDVAIHASHILIQVNNNDSVKALQQAKEIYQKAKHGEDFATLAKQFSTDPSAANGGDLGWFAKGRMVKPFEDAAFKTNPGQIVGPVHTQFGYHIIKVLAKDSREIKIVDLHMGIHVGPQTKSDISQRAKDFAYLAKEGNFQQEAEQSKYAVQETSPFQKDAFITGIGLNNTVNKFAFNNKMGIVSEALTIQNGYGVFLVSGVTEAGVRPFDEVKSTVELKVRREKNIEKLTQLANELIKTLAPGDSLRTIAANRSDIVVQHLGPFMATGFIPGIGRDVSFIGAVSSLSVGQISKPFVGQRGIYVLKLLNKSPFDSTTYNSQKDIIRSQIINEKRNRFLTEWTDQLKKAADIVDNRDQFYR